MKDVEADPAPTPPSAEDPPMFATGVRIGDSDDPGAAHAGQGWLPWILAAVSVFVLVGLAYWISSMHTPGRLESISVPYAAHIVFSNLRLTQATNFAGDQVIYLDGVVTNRGNRTVTGISLRVLFASGTGNPPQIEQVPLSLTRPSRPFIETEPVSAAPLAPGSRHKFRLIFDEISPAWNRQIPALSIENVAFLH